MLAPVETKVETKVKKSSKGASLIDAVDCCDTSKVITFNSGALNLHTYSVHYFAKPLRILMPTVPVTLKTTPILEQ